MSELDGDDGVLKSTTGNPVARDIVQFAPFHQYRVRCKCFSFPIFKLMFLK